MATAADPVQQVEAQLEYPGLLVDMEEVNRMLVKPHPGKTSATGPPLSDVFERAAEKADVERSAAEKVNMERVAEKDDEEGTAAEKVDVERAVAAGTQGEVEMATAADTEDAPVRTCRDQSEHVRTCQHLGSSAPRHPEYYKVPQKIHEVFQTFPNFSPKFPPPATNGSVGSAVLRGLRGLRALCCHIAHMFTQNMYHI